MTNQLPWETMQPVDGMRYVSPHRPRAMTGPTHPHVLFPTHRPSTVHTSDLFFVTPQKSNRPTSSSVSPRESPVTPSHRSFISPPPIPPKPFALQHERPEVQSPADIVDIRQTNARREGELSVVLALSQPESVQRQSVLNRLNSQEEADLARALAESLKTATSISTLVAAHSPTTIPTLNEDNVVASTSNNVGLATGSKGKARLNEFPLVESSDARPLVNTVNNSYDNPCVNDEAIARRLAEEERTLSQVSASDNTASIEGVASSSLGRSQSLPSSSQLVADDERYARQVAEQEAEMSGTLHPRSKSALATVGARTSNLPDPPPPYEASLSAFPGHPSSADFSSSSLNVTRNRSAGSQPSAQFEPSGSASESSSPLTGVYSPPIVITSDQNLSGTPQPPHQIDRSVSSTSLSSPLSSPATDRGFEDSQITCISSCVADELLQGISIGFDPPVISPQTLTWQNPLPTMISLPYGRSVPLHIQAPSWRHMLKFLTRLPGTTIQATIEAMAISKSDHRLRIVVQYVKPHLASTEWRTILWLTLEHPVPDDVTGRSRYVNDVNILPWSYTFSTVPRLLRGVADSQLSKIYTIPACNSLPFPTLPITFPYLAIYLIEALEISRRHVNDSSSGFRKLVKMTETCYPDANINDAYDPDKRRVGGILKKVIGRNNRRRGGNEDTYDLVTPFVANEWG